MENTFIIVFDFYKSRSKYNPKSEHDISDIAVDYMDTCHTLKNKMIEMFPNKVIEISYTTFILKSELNEEELLNTIKEVFSKEFYITVDTDTNTMQLYIAKIENLKSFTFQSKKIELEYILKVEK